MISTSLMGRMWNLLSNYMISWIIIGTQLKTTDNVGQIVSSDHLRLCPHPVWDGRLQILFQIGVEPTV